MQLQFKKPTICGAILLGIVGAVFAQEPPSQPRQNLQISSEQARRHATPCIDGVCSGQSHTDKFIKCSIECSLRWDAYVDAAAIQIQVHHGTATLLGIVGSTLEKSRAESITMKAFGGMVNTDLLQVSHWQSGRNATISTVAGASDEMTAKVIEQTLRDDPQVLVDHLDVQFSDGIVTLRGTVENLHDMQAIVRLILSVAGVQSVSARPLVLHSNGVADAQELTWRAHVLHTANENKLEQFDASDLPR